MIECGSTPIRPIVVRESLLSTRTNCSKTVLEWSKSRSRSSPWTRLACECPMCSWSRVTCESVVGEDVNEVGNESVVEELLQVRGGGVVEELLRERGRW